MPEIPPRPATLPEPIPQLGFRERLSKIHKDLDEARHRGMEKDAQRIRHAKERVVGGISKAAGGAEKGARVADKVGRGAEEAAKGAVKGGWAALEIVSTETGKAVENIAKAAFDKVKYPAIIAATPVVAVGFAVEQTAIGLREAGIHTAKKFADVKAGVREFFSRGNEARKAAADAFRLVPDSQGQKFLRSKFEEQKSMRNAEYGRQLADVRAKNPVSALRNAIGGVLK